MTKLIAFAQLSKAPTIYINPALVAYLERGSTKWEEKNKVESTTIGFGNASPYSSEKIRVIGRIDQVAAKLGFELDQQQKAES